MAIIQPVKTPFVPTKTVSTDPTKIQAQKVNQNGQNNGVFVPQANLNNIASGKPSNGLLPNPVPSKVVATPIQGNPTQAAGQTYNNSSGGISGASSGNGTTTPPKTVADLAGTNPVQSNLGAPPYGTDQAGLQQWKDKNPAAYNAWTAAGGRVGDINLNQGQTGQDVLINQANETWADYTKLTGQPKPSDVGLNETLQQWQADKQKTKDAQDMANLQQSNALQAQQDQLTQKNAGQQASGAEAAVNAQFAGSREGLSSSGNSMLAGKFTADTEAKLTLLGNQMAFAQQSRDQAVTNLQNAQEANNVHAAESYQHDLDNANAQLQQIQDAHNKAVADANKQASDYADKAVSFAQGAGGGALASMNLDQISALYHIDQPTAAAVQNLAIQKQQADASSPEGMLKIAQYNRELQSIKTDSLDSQTKALNLVQSLLAGGQNEAALKIAKENGLTNSPDYQQATQQITSGLKDQASTFNSSGIYKPVNGVYNVTPNGKGGIKIDTPIGQCPANGRGQCGQFVNDFFNKNIHLFGDSYASKQQMVNSQVPVVGGAFIMKTGGQSAQYGHTGIITQVYKDGSFDYTDSNRHDISAPETVDSNHFSGSNYASGGYTGFFDPSKAAPGWTPNKNFSNVNQSRQETINNLIDQGFNDPKEILNMVNVDNTGKKVGDFTIDEVKQRIDQYPTQSTTNSSSSSEADAFAKSFGGGDQTSTFSTDKSGTISDPTMEELSKSYASDPKALNDLTEYAKTISTAAPGSALEKQQIRSATNAMIARANQIKQQESNKPPIPAPAPGSVKYEQYGLLAKAGINPNDPTDQKAAMYLDRYLKGGDMSSPKSLAMGVKDQDAFDSAVLRANNLFYSATGYSLPSQSDLKTNTDIIDYNKKLLNTLGQQESVVSKNFANEIDNLDKNGLNQKSQPINDFLNHIMNLGGDPATAAYLSQNATLGTELSQLLTAKSNGGPTVGDKLEAANLIPKGAGEAQQKAILKTLMQEAEFSRQAIQNNNAELYKQTDPLERNINNPNRQAEVTQSFNTSILPKGFSASSSAPVSNDDIMSKAN